MVVPQLAHNSRLDNLDRDPHLVQDSGSSCKPEERSCKRGQANNHHVRGNRKSNYYGALDSSWFLGLPQCQECDCVAVTQQNDWQEPRSHSHRTRHVIFSFFSGRCHPGRTRRKFNITCLPRGKTQHQEISKPNSSVTCNKMRLTLHAVTVSFGGYLPSLRAWPFTLYVLGFTKWFSETALTSQLRLTHSAAWKEMKGEQLSRCATILYHHSKVANLKRFLSE